MSAGYRLTARTLDFHSKNGGSNPPSLKIKKSIFFNFNRRLSAAALNYKLAFVSFFPPQTTNKFKFNASALTIKKKIYVKQSYVLLTWFYYLNSFKVSRKNMPNIRIAYLPVRRNIFTATKAPMAHKTNSKEQFLYLYHKFLVTCKLPLRLGRDVDSPDKGLALALILKKNFKAFETSLFILKSASFFFNVDAAPHLNYFRFLR